MPDDVRCSTVELIDWRREYQDLVESLWHGYEVYSSNGATNAQFKRHIWPVIENARKRLRELCPDHRYVYAIGFKDGCGSYGMFFGPTPNLQECLDYVPPEDERVCYVLEFDNSTPRDRTNRIVARWRPSTSSWVQRK